MHDELLIFVGISITLSLAASLRRSHIILVMSSLNMAFQGALLLMSQDFGLLLISLAALLNLIFCGVAILVFRSRGRLRMDDYRDLRG